jgi:uncharacterized protein (TIRG00374 family)
MNNYIRWLLRLIGPVLLIYFLATSNLQSIGRVFTTLAPMPLILSLALYVVFIAIKSWRWNLLMRELRVEAPPLGMSMILYAIGLFLGATTPGQSGDFVKAWYLRERGQPLPPVLFSILLDRLFDFVVMALLTLLGLFVFIDVFPAPLRIPAVIIAIGFIVGTPVLMARGPRDWLMNRMLPIMPERIRAAIERWRDQFASLSLRPALFTQLLLSSSASAFVTMWRIYLLFLALSLTNVPILAVVSATAVVAILQALPISFSGLGVREAVLVPVLALYGYSQEQALSLSALYLLLNIEHILIGFLVSLRYPLGAGSTTTPPPVAATEPTEQTSQ